MPTLTERRQEWGELIHEARSITDVASEEERDLTSEEEERFDRLMDQADRIEERIGREERLAEREDRSREIPDPADRPDPDDEERDDPEHNETREAFGRYLRSGSEALSGEEIRALEATDTTSGGALVAPEEFVRELIQAVDDQVFMRRLANVLPPIPMAQSLGVPTLENDPADADWTSELATGSEDSAMDFGKRELQPHPLAKRLKVSNKLLRAAVLNAEQIVRDRLAYKFAVSEEKAFLTGDGASKPLGVFTASDSGISTSRDVSEDMNTDGMTADGLISVRHTLKGQYWSRARWLFHRDGIKQIRKLKDSNGQYIWQPGLQGGNPNEILETPYEVSEFVPNTFTADSYVGILGDFGTGYWIVDALSMTVQRLVELYAENNQVGFIGRLEADGMPVLEEAFVRVQLAS